MLQCSKGGMRIAIIDESASRASIIEEGLSQLPDCEISVVTNRHGLLARMAEIDPEIEKVKNQRNRRARSDEPASQIR